MRLLARSALAALAGAAAGLSFEPHHWVALLPFAVAGLTLLAAAAPRLRSGFWLGLVFGTAFMLVLLPWLQVIGVYAWIPLAIVEGLFYGLAGLATRAVRRLPGWPVWAATGWVRRRGAARRGAVRRLPVGQAGVRDRGHPAGPGVRLRRRGRRDVRGGPGRDDPGLGGAAGAPYAGAGGGRPRAAALAGLPRLAGAVRTPAGDPVAGGKGATVAWPRSRATCPARGSRPFAQRRAVLDNHVDATSTLAGGSRPATRRGPTW